MIELPISLRERLAFWLAHVPEAFFPLYLVGGTVRDILLDRPIEDIDFALFGAQKLFNHARKNKEFATVVMGENKPKTCYRLVHRKNTNNYIDLCEIEGETIEEDLSRRDFTLNAIAVELDESAEVKRIIDPFNGAGHTQEKKVVVLGDRAFREDPLRMLRAFRFSCTLGFSLAKETVAAISENCSLIAKVSQERVRDELVKILECRNATEIIREMDRAGVLEGILPEIVPMRGCEQNKYHHLDVWDHSLLSMENCEKVMNRLDEFYPDTAEEIAEVLADGRKAVLLKFAALLHDVAKPASRKKLETGKITFYGHEEAGEGMAAEIGKRLKLSNKDSAFLSLVVREHMHVKVLHNDEVKNNTRIRWFHKHLDDAAAIIIMGMADILSKNARIVTDEVVEKYRVQSGAELKKYFTGYKQSFALKPLITGKDLIELGLEPGKAFKSILHDIRDAQLNGEITTKDQALTFVSSLQKK